MTAQYDIAFQSDDIREIKKQLRELFNRPLSSALLDSVSAEVERTTGIIFTQADVMSLLDPYPYVKARFLHPNYDIGNSGFFDVIAAELLGSQWPAPGNGGNSMRDFIDTLQLAASKAGYAVINKAAVLAYERELSTPGDRLRYFDFYLTDPGLNARYHWLKAVLNKDTSGAS